jgi:diadenosine tetraphosphatase ApaH/serine/threonine PP2A family protein phosphatase
MTWALITDLHANLQAFEAVLAHAAAQGASRYALLGDFVGYGANPSEVLSRVMALQAAGAVVVQGNHDAATSAGSRPGMHADARAVVEWTRARLEPAQLDWLSALPLRARDGDCLFTHANAYDPAAWDYIVGRSEAVRSLTAAKQAGARMNICGHMHEPKLFHLSGTGKAGEFTPQAGVTMPLPAHRQWLAIPGSCGQPRDGNPAACYALWEPGDGATVDGWIRFERVPYDVDAAVAALRASSLPTAIGERLAQRLLRGE